MADMLRMFFFNLIITAGVYLAVPAIIAIIGKKHSAKTIKWIVVINGAVVWFFFAIIRALSGIRGSGASVFLWSAIAHGILRYYNLETEKHGAASFSETSDNKKDSLSPLEKSAPCQSRCGRTKAENIRYIPVNYDQIKEDKRIPDPVISDAINKENERDKTSIIYCQRCGKKLEQGCVYCSYCGKPVNKKKTSAWKLLLVVIAVVVVMAIAAVFAVNKYLYNKQQLTYYNDAVSAMEAGDFIIAQGHLSNIHDYENQYPEVTAYINAGVLMEKGSYILALTAFEESGLPIPAEIKNTLYEEIYIGARSRYRMGLYAKAEIWFKKIESYRDAGKYLTLISARKASSDVRYEELADMLLFEDANFIVLQSESYFTKFLKGKWKTPDGKRYFEMNEDLSVKYNLPEQADGDEYIWKDGAYCVQKKDGSRVYNFTFMIMDEDTIEVFCYKNNKIYKMCRQ